MQFACSYLFVNFAFAGSSGGVGSYSTVPFNKSQSPKDVTGRAALLEPVAVRPQWRSSISKTPTEVPISCIRTTKARRQQEEEDAIEEGCYRSIEQLCPRARCETLTLPGRETRDFDAVCSELPFPWPPICRMGEKPCIAAHACKPSSHLGVPAFGLVCRVVFRFPLRLCL